MVDNKEFAIGSAANKSWEVIKKEIDKNKKEWKPDFLYQELFIIQQKKEKKEEEKETSIIIQVF